MKKYSYDSKCEELAEYFLTDETHTQQEKEELAQSIQDAIENWLQAKWIEDLKSYGENHANQK